MLQTEIHLLDGKGKKLAKVSIPENVFAFKVPKDKGFRLEVQSEKYRVTYLPTHELVRGDDVLLTLVKKK